MPKHKVITLAPVVLDRNGLAAAETLASTGLAFTLDGALADSTFDRNGLVASVTPTAETVLTLVSAAKVLVETNKPVRVSVFGGSDESGKVLHVNGRNKFGGIIHEAITMPNADTIFGTTDFYEIISITASAATTGAIEVGINGKYKPVVPQYIAIYSGSNDSSRTYTVTGTDRYGDDVTEDITGPNNSTVVGLVNFQTVRAVVIDSTGSAGAVEVGIDGTCSSQWYVTNYRGAAADLNIFLDVISGTGTYAVETTMQRLDNDSGNKEKNVIATADATITGKTADFQGQINPMPLAIRLACTAFTSGSARIFINSN